MNAIAASINKGPSFSRRMGDLVRIVWARLYAGIGWPGSVGLIGLVFAGAYAIWIVQFVPSLAAEGNRLAATPQVKVQAEPATTQSRLVPPALPYAADSLDILKRIQHAVTGSGLPWPQAEYRVTALNNESLATLEIRTTLKGPYPKVRQVLATLLDTEPALALRELTLSRPNGDTAEVEAKIHWVIFLADAWPAAQVETKP